MASCKVMGFAWFAARALLALLAVVFASGIAVMLETAIEWPWWAWALTAAGAAFLMIPPYKYQKRLNIEHMRAVETFERARDVIASERDQTIQDIVSRKNAQVNNLNAVLREVSKVRTAVFERYKIPCPAGGNASWSQSMEDPWYRLLTNDELLSHIERGSIRRARRHATNLVNHSV